jgi:hypothetical protein
MRIPPPPERIKEAPAHALRAVFAGVGQVLLITERVRQRAIEQVHPQLTSVPAEAQAHAPDVPPPPSPESAAAAATQAAASRAAASQDAAARAAAPTAAKAEVPEPQAGASEAAAAGLPVPNYDELTIASLRARLRALDVAQVRGLLDYERAHASRANVITMFERRIAKLEGTEDADTTAG